MSRTKPILLFSVLAVIAVMGAAALAADAAARLEVSPQTDVCAIAPAAPANLAIRVQPGDADIVIDGEQWHRSSGDRLELQVTAGVHRIEVRKEGYQSFTTDITVRAGEASAINVSLSRA